MQEITIKGKSLIECDFEAAKAYLDGVLNVYRGMVFTEETKKDAKNTVAELRKEKKAFDDRIKAVKKEWMKPYEAFFEKACEISDLYDEPIKFINDQVSIFEAKRVEEKKAVISSIYLEMVPEEEWQDIIPLFKIYNSKWENATVNEKAIREEIHGYKLAAKEAITTIKSMESDKEEQAIELYKRNLDLTECIVFLNNYEKQKREIMAAEQERIQRETEERIRSEERAKIEAEFKKAEEIAEAEERARAEVIDALVPEEDAGTPTREYEYRLTMTKAQKEACEIYFNSCGINFEDITLPFC